jgi:uncharacterized membrane protein (UPF0127 family)
LQGHAKILGVLVIFVVQDMEVVTVKHVQPQKMQQIHRSPEVAISVIVVVTHLGIQIAEESDMIS